MNENYETQFSDELYHYGRKGMKWYQNIFTAGKALRRKRKQKKALEKARQAKVAKKQEEEAKQKAIKSGNAKEVLKYKDNMTTDELRDATNRIRAIQDLEGLTPKEVSKGKKFSERVMVKDVIAPAATDVGKQLVKSGMTYTVNKLLKLDDEYKIHTNNKKK